DRERNRDEEYDIDRQRSPQRLGEAHADKFRRHQEHEAVGWRDEAEGQRRDQHDAICTGLMSPACVNAFTSGMKMMIVGTGSMKSPMTVNSPTISSMIRCGSLPAMDVIQSAITMAPRR